VSHKAATPIGFTVTVEAECIEVRGPRARFRLVAHDGVDEIGAGTHERFIVAWDRFNRGVDAKRAKAASGAEA
jgi:fluoroacetyl-CoA thioesterase